MEVGLVSESVVFVDSTQVKARANSRKDEEQKNRSSGVRRNCERKLTGIGKPMERSL